MKIYQKCFLRRMNLGWCFSNFGTSTPWELVRKSHLQAPPQAPESKTLVLGTSIWVLISLLGDSDAHWSWSTTDLVWGSNIKTSMLDHIRWATCLPFWVRVAASGSIYYLLLTKYYSKSSTYIRPSPSHKTLWSRLCYYPHCSQS